MPPYITARGGRPPVRAHRTLTFAGAALLAVALLSYTGDPEGALALGAGSAAIAALCASFALFERDRRGRA